MNNQIANTSRYLQLLEGCIKSKSLVQAKTVHQHLLKNGRENLSIVLDKLTRVYVSFSKLELARRVFNSIQNPERQNNVLLWNQLIRAYAWEGPFEHAIDLYFEMIESGVTPNKFTYPFALKACSSLQDVDIGKEIHDHAKSLSLGSDVYICTALIDLYAKCGRLVDARQVFGSMTVRDVVAWNAMIAGSSLHGVFAETVELVVQMQEEGLSPNSSTIVAILPVLGEAVELRHGKAVHGYCTRRRFDSDVVVGTGLLDMYGKCSCLPYARRVFNLIGVKNEVTWTAMIGVCVACDSMRGALELFDKVVSEHDILPSPIMLASVLRACAKLTDVTKGRQIHCYSIKSGFAADLIICNTLVSLYAKCGIVADAMITFDKMDLKDIVSCNAIISGCVQNGYAEMGLNILCKMASFGIEPDMETMIAFFPACSQLGALMHGARGHSYSITQGFTASTSICNAIIDMYSKCGKIDIARLVFDNMSTRDSVSWNTIIMGYGIHGLGLEAVSLFHGMQSAGLKPDDVTFICLLSACSHSCLVEEGKRWFSSMSEDFNITPGMEHYLCLVDLLGRAGLLNEAHHFVSNMPFEPDLRIWNSLLSACRVHKNIELGEKVSRMTPSLAPENTGNIVLLSNIYSTAGRWDDAARIRIIQRDMGLRKSPGCSWLEINGVVHAFVGGDRSHPQWTLMNKKLEELLVEMKRRGYNAEYSFVLQDVEEEEKEKILLYHSEKLAVALALLILSPNKPISVTKNLRVCVDCHAALKYISIIEKRTITVRDAIRFHHFTNGTCSCGDFW